MKKAALILLSGLVLLVAPFLWGWLHRDDPAPGSGGGLPWQIDMLPDGRTRVMGLEPGRSRLSEARALWPEGTELGLLEAPGRPTTLQAFVPNARAGFVTGKLVLTAAPLATAELEGYQARASARQPTASGGWRYTLQADDALLAWNAPIQVLAFHPAARLDDEVLRQRFGEPAERLNAPDGVSHGFYPAVGLAITRTSEGRAVLQYTPPSSFATLRAELSGGSGPR